MKECMYRVIFHNGAEEFVESSNRREAYIKARAMQTGFIRAIRKLTRRSANWEAVE